MKRLLIFCIGVILCLGAMFSSTVVHAEGSLVYVSGNPDGYPVEYYDSESEKYIGYAAVILEEFAEKYGYELEYLKPGKTDSRSGHYKNSQVDIISCCQKSDGFPIEAWENGVELIVGDTEYRFIFTSAADDTLKSRLKEYCGSITKEHSNAILMSVTSKGQPKTMSRHGIAVCIALFLSIAALVIVLIVFKKKSDEAKKNNDTDVLTGVGNFNYLEKYTAQFINNKNRPLYTALYAGAQLKDDRDDLNSLLKYMAVELNHEMGDTDILARIDNGFFFLKNCSEFSNIEEWTEGIVTRLRDNIKEGSSYSSAVITAGIYPLGAHDHDLDIMISRAQYCSRFAEKQELIYSVYSEKVELAVKETEELAHDIRTAFKRDEFIIYLQFFVDSKTNKILGAESLSRWNHPSKGVLLPKQYITVLEDNESIHELDYTVLRKSCEFLEDYYKKSDQPFFIASNFSRNTIMRSDYVETVKNIIEQYDFPRECLLIEVTEYARITDTELLFNNISKLKSLGVRIVIDDFGCGLSDLIDIGKGKFDGVKFDKVFISGAHTTADDIIMESLITLMHKLNMTVISEGIETEEDAERVSRLGCSVVQGFYYYIPLPRNEALRELFKR